MRNLFPFVLGALLWVVTYNYTAHQKHVKFATVRLFDNSLRSAWNSSKDDAVLLSDATKGNV